MYRELWRVSTLNARNVVAVSEKTAAQSRELTGRKDIQVVSPGWDHLENYDSDESLARSLSFTDFYLTFAHHSNKRADLALRALAGLSGYRDFENHGLVILGARGETLSSLRKLANELRITHSVFFHSFAPNGAYKWLIQNAVAVLFLSSDEGFGIPVIEALGQRTPVIASREAGIPGHFLDYVITVSDDVKEISNAMMLPVPKFLAGETPQNSWLEILESLRNIAER